MNENFTKILIYDLIALTNEEASLKASAFLLERTMLAALVVIRINKAGAAGDCEVMKGRLLLCVAACG